MCNAYTLLTGKQAIIDLARTMAMPTNDLEDFAARYRIGIKSQGLVLRPQPDGPAEWTWSLWGLVPSGTTKGQRYALNNARADKLGKWPWKVFQDQRCVVPASGFFEPEKVAGSKEKVPWRYYSRTDGALFFMPGLWSEYVNEETGELLVSYTIIITDANEAIYIHDRMPVIFDPATAKLWLESPTLPTDLLTPCDAEWLVGWRVGDAAKNSRSPNHPSLVEPVEQ